ncbi:MAG: hypothetical protein HY834_07925 [Devosia nanyangense]|uniref:Uncharacterized protein n=1 Tax=Devosia nanyangense TaxID=1228055 RepID=A0A933NW94_9HYPH|nr:hypothetical protein [Devosia nanyangense]
MANSDPAALDTQHRQLVARRDALTSELAVVEGQLAALEDARRRPGASLHLKPLANADEQRVAAEVRRIIQERMQPVSRAALLSELIERGVAVAGNAPEASLAGVLDRVGKAAGVIRLEEGDYWLAGHEWPDDKW